MKIFCSPVTSVFLFLIGSHQSDVIGGIHLHVDGDAFVRNGANIGHLFLVDCGEEWADDQSDTLRFQSGSSINWDALQVETSSL